MHCDSNQAEMQH